MRDVTVAINQASYSGNKGAAAMLQSSIKQLREKYGERLQINLMSVYPSEDKEQIPFDFIKIINAKPEKILFVSFPLALLYWLFRWCPPMKKMILKNKILKAYYNSDLVLDEAGISFSEDRGFVMTTYAFVHTVIPMLLGVPVVKYSQALGTFNTFYNRVYAKMALKKVNTVIARGEITRANLEGIGITENVVVCADGAFSMEDDKKATEYVNDRIANDNFFESDNIVGVSISSAIRKKCIKNNIEYEKIMAAFVDELTNRGYKVMLIANAARINSEKTRNNDLPVGDRVYELLENKDDVRWYHEEFDAEVIREWISKFRFLVASRFHAMIGALEKEVPCLLVGWSHKYQEVLDMFELGAYTSDYKALSLETLIADFEEFVKHEGEIREKLKLHHNDVIDSSRDNIRITSEVLDAQLKKIDSKPVKRGKLDYNHPEKYLGDYLMLRKGYAACAENRINVASGGMITNLLCNMLSNGTIDGAWVVKTAFENNQLTYKTYIATTLEEIRDAGTSVYMSVPILSHLDLLEEFQGKVAVVMTPCMLRSLTTILEKRPELKEKVVIKLGFYCGGCENVKGTELAATKGIGKNAFVGAKRLYYRRGIWRGTSAVVYENGTEKYFSYSKNYCAYKNAFFFTKESCFSCKDHFAEFADISFGDVWLKEMKKEDVKYTSCIVRTSLGKTVLEKAKEDGDLTLFNMKAKDMLRSQKRALALKYLCADDVSNRKWNQKWVKKLARKNNDFGKYHYERLEKIPVWMVYLYMCFCRVLLNF